MRRLIQAFHLATRTPVRLNIGPSEWIYDPRKRTMHCPVEDLRLDGMKLIDTAKGQPIAAEREDRLPCRGWPSARCKKLLEDEYCLQAKLWMFRYAGGEPGYFIQLLTWNPQAYDFNEKCVLGIDEVRSAAKFLTDIVEDVDNGDHDYEPIPRGCDCEFHQCRCEWPELQ